MVKSKHKKIIKKNTLKVKNMEYSTISKQVTANLSKQVKKKNGIYFTPPSCIHKNLKILKPYMKNIKTILEPSCGTCEFITALRETFPNINATITGIEFNKIIYDSISHLNKQNIRILNKDFLKYSEDVNYDLIIGNPPFLVMKKKDVDKLYYPYFDGRPNIFILFIIKSLSLLNNKGILSFVLPRNFLNCMYYEKTRSYIATHYQILNITECNDKYIETQQNTIILIVRKQKRINNTKFTIEVHNYTIFGCKTNISKIKKLYCNSKSLHDLGFTVTVGKIVWNQCKNILTEDNNKTRLIYNSDIKNNEMILKHYKNIEKKNFINKPGLTHPLLVINRGYGVGKYNFNHCLIDGSFEYLIENHLICIRYTKTMPNKTLIQMYKKIIRSLSDKRTLDFISLYVGNSAINTTELNYILPIYQDI